MIRVEAITIREFRGIRDLTLKLGSRNFAVCGPNGTGKSGIVDALEFGLTGNISRLSGSGTGGLSVKEHGPHVDSRTEPEKASVALSLSIPSLGKQVTLERTVERPRDPKITPDDGALRALLNQVVLHPEFTLSRRELIRYVLSEPGKRAKEVQALPRLDSLEALRSTLQKITNAEEKGLHPLARVRREARDRLAQSLGITELSPENVLAAANQRRATLALPPLTVLEATTTITEGLATATGAPTVIRIPKTQALADIRSLREELTVLSAEDSRQTCSLSLDSVSELGKDAANLEGIEREFLLQSALKLFDEHTCPVCGTEWEPEKFKSVVTAKLKHFEDVKTRRAAVEAQLTPIADRFDQLVSTLSLVAKYGPQLSHQSTCKRFGHMPPLWQPARPNSASYSHYWKHRLSCLEP
jgi:DNA repair exonuclease SbcCD ATPase subunit